MLRAVIVGFKEVWLTMLKNRQRKCGHVPEHLAPYIDYEATGRDMS